MKGNNCMFPESRVREDRRLMAGEEFLSWQWIPDIQWSPLSHPGPNPYLNRYQMRSPPPPPSPAASQSSSVMTSSPSSWQGSAFNALNRNVAAPLVAPTTCLKVRNEFELPRVHPSGGFFFFHFRSGICLAPNPSGRVGCTK